MSPTVSVISVAHDVADARLHRMCAAFERAGAEVSLRGLGDPVDAPEGVHCDTWARVGRVRRLGRACWSPFRHRSQLVVVVDPDLVPGAVIARKCGLIKVLVCDVHEDYVSVVEDRTWGSAVARWAGLTVARVGTRLASHADFTVVADDHVPPLRAQRRRVVTNAPTIGPVVPDVPLRGLRAVYIGDVRRSRGAIAMVEAMIRCPDWKLDIVGPINSERDRNEMERLIGGSDRIRLWGRQPPERSWEIAQHASVGLCVLDDTPAFRDSLPTKFLQYLNEGMAVITSPMRRPMEIVEQHRVGAMAATADEIVGHLNAWASDHTELDAIRKRAIAWSRDNLNSIDEFDAVAKEIVEHARS